MKPDVLSVWLMADQAWQREFSAVVRELAERFSTPRFQPHLTLIGGQRFDPEDLGRRVAPVAHGTAPLGLPIVDVVTGDAYFRSFYALFAAEGALVDLKRRIDRAVLGAESPAFMPHVSLLYGPVEAGPKAAAAAGYRSVLQGRTARFDRIEIVRSGDDIPVEAWETVVAFPLGRQGPRRPQ